MKKDINVLDLFCGAGGFSYGFMKAGFNVLLGIDNDKTAIRTFQKNHKNSKTICKDIFDIKKEDIIRCVGKKQINLIIGGLPCQGFSLAGKRDPKDPRNSLFKQFIRIIFEIKPKIFIAENVQGLLSMKTQKGYKVIDIIKKESLKHGYFIKEYLLNAKDFGVPQNRRRVILVGCRKRNIEIKFSKKKEIPIKKVLLRKEEVPKIYFYSEKRIRGFKRRAKQNKKLKRGYGWQFLDLNKPSYTISARYYKDGAEALIKYSDKQIRMLTPEECALIQSFPKEYEFFGGKIKTYKQIGNAVPPQLSLNIAKSIKKLRW